MKAKISRQEDIICFLLALSITAVAYLAVNLIFN